VGRGAGSQPHVPFRQLPGEVRAQERDGWVRKDGEVPSPAGQPATAGMEGRIGSTSRKEAAGGAVPAEGVAPTAAGVVEAIATLAAAYGAGGMSQVSFAVGSSSMREISNVLGAGVDSAYISVWEETASDPTCFVGLC